MNTDSRWCIKHHGYLWISAARQGLLRDWNRLAVRRTNASAITQHGKFSNLFCSLVCFVYRTYAPPSTTRWCLSFCILHSRQSQLYRPQLVAHPNFSACYLHTLQSLHFACVCFFTLQVARTHHSTTPGAFCSDAIYDNT
jgi:hypothetical protein